MHHILIDSKSLNAFETNIENHFSTLLLSKDEKQAFLILNDGSIIEEKVHRYFYAFAEMNQMANLLVVLISDLFTCLIKCLPGSKFHPELMKLLW